MELKYFTWTTLFFLAGLPLQAQPTFNQSIQPTQHFIPWQAPRHDHAADADGFIYAVYSIKDRGSEVAKFDPEGNPLWTRAILGQTHSLAQLALDPQGNVAATGEALTILFSPDGTELWRREGHKGYKLVFSPEGTLYVLGDKLTALSPDGTTHWSHPGPFEGGWLGAYMQLDDNNRIAIAGHGQPPGGGSRAYAAHKLDASGNLLFSGYYQADQVLSVRGLAIDGHNHMILTGFEDTHPHPATWDPMAHTVKFHGETGQIIWADIFEGAAGSGVTVDRWNHVYVASHGAGYLSKIHPDGQTLWRKDNSTSGRFPLMAGAMDVVVDGADNPVVLGVRDVDWWPETIFYGKHQSMMRLDPNGNYMDSLIIPELFLAEARGLLDPLGRVVLSSYTGSGYWDYRLTWYHF